MTLQIVNKTGELGGRLEDSLRLYKRQDPYQVISDLTIMPGSVLKIDPGVTVEFAPRVGILVLGQLIAKGEKGHEIVMKPSSADSALPLPKYLNSQELVFIAILMTCSISLLLIDYVLWNIHKNI